ncbi:transmembrane protein 33-like [Styela clava]|uniref:transmembrane protein 33-like n=1 Tax=Styela clava TaxID=7725 RepID=UPI001939C396|nr:transmembrane protein 33-like [Styela clava]
MSERSEERRREEAGAQEARDTGSILNFMSARKIGTAMWVMRLYTIFLSIQYMFFCSAFDMGQYFQRAMLSNGVICALRLHQRIPDFRMTRQHFAQMMVEDSAHYLMYSLIFLTSHPITIALVPVTVFALLHACSFTRQMLDVHGPNSYPALRKIINHVARHQATLFRFIALNEILIMPTTIAMIFIGRTTILAPFLYYKFLTYRYLSRRNPYCRLSFYELRLALENMCASQNCPSILRSAVFKLISFSSRLAPPAASFQNQTQTPPEAEERSS